MKVRHPIALSSWFAAPFSTTVAKTFTPDSTGLVNPSKWPMLIDEIKISARIQNMDQSPEVTATTCYPLSFMEVAFQLASWRFSDDFLPVLAYASNTRAGRHSVRPGFLAGAGTPGDTYIGAEEDLITWKLPKPLYVAPGDLIVPVFRRKKTESTWEQKDFRVRITYLGRIVDMLKPRMIDVPYVACVQNPRLSTSSLFTDTASLYNKFQVPWVVERLIGYFTNTITGTQVAGQPALQGFFPTTSVASNGVGIMLKDHNDVPLTNIANVASLTLANGASVGFNIPFGPQNNSWIINKVLEPREFISVEFPLVTTSSVPMPVISAVGTRQEALR